MKVLICISSKSPNPMLTSCIHKLYDIQIQDEHTYTICVVDSDSDNRMEYENVQTEFPNVQLHFIQNKNYEYGAWKYALQTYPDYDFYFCLQDTVFLKKYIPLDLITDQTAYTFHYSSGYYDHLSIKNVGIELLRDSGLEYTSILDTNFNCAQHSTFFVTRNTMKDLFQTLVHPPINKNGSCAYERNFGIYFLLKKFTTFNLYDFAYKISGGRP